ncbi:MAG: hypothetical protein ACRERE_10140 [Candidatus Entotheonellia bacterium]
MLTCGRWYGADPVSERQVEERRQARGEAVDHATSTRWVRQDAPPLEEAFHHRTRPVWVRGRMAETDLRGTGPWRSLDRAVAKTGPTSAVLWPEERASREAPVPGRASNP